MFPNKLDNANVLFYTNKGEYGNVYCTTSTECEKVYYLAICQYKDEDKFYLFLCDDSFGVITDDLCDSIEECKQLAMQKQANIIWFTN